MHTIPYIKTFHTHYHNTRSSNVPAESRRAFHEFARNLLETHLALAEPSKYSLIVTTIASGLGNHDMHTDKIKLANIAAFLRNIDGGLGPSVTS